MNTLERSIYIGARSDLRSELLAAMAERNQYYYKRSFQLRDINHKDVLLLLDEQKWLIDMLNQTRELDEVTT